MMAKVLIVDDEKSIRISLREFLRDAGYVVAVAEDADEATELLRAGDFDVLVTDIILPRITGVDLLKSIKDTSPHVQVILMTGEPTIETASEAVRSDAFDYLTKPIDKELLLKTVANAARLKSLDDDRRRLTEENHQYRNNLEHLVEERTTALRESEQSTRLLLESAFDGIIISVKGKVVQANQAFAKMFGYAVEEVIGLSSLELTTPESAELIADTISKGIEKPYEIVGVKKDGTHFELEVVDRNCTYRGQVARLTAMRDITERKQADRTNKEQARLLDLIFEHTLDSIVLLDKDYNFIRVSETYAKSCQIAGAEFPGQNHFELFPSNFKDEADEAKKGKYIYRKSARPFIFPDHPEWGITYWDLGLVPILDEEREIELFLFTLKDVTRRVRQEKEIQESKARLLLVKNMGMEISSDMSIEEVVTNSLNNIFKMLPDYRVSYGVRIDENLYRCMASVGPSSMKSIEGTDFDMTDAPEFVEALTKEHIVTNDILQDEIVAPLRSQLEKIQVRAMINTPVTHAVGLKGLIWLDSDLPHSWSDHEITTLADASRYMAVAVKNAQLVEEQSKTAADLREASEKLRAESQELTLKNIALNQVLIHLEKEKQNYKEQISESVESLLMPIVKKLKKRGGNLSPRDISLLENSLDSIVGKEIDVFRKNLVKLSPRELDICELIREGKSSKEISSVLNLSTLTIHKHRESIRSKLQLKNKSTNLSAYLRVRESLLYNTQSVRN